MGAIKKKCTPPIESTNKKVHLENAENQIQKAEIERMRKLLGEKIKDPKLAKKAAMILSEMLK